VTEGVLDVKCPADILKMNNVTICQAKTNRTKLAKGTARVSFISAANSKGGKGFKLRIIAIYNPYGKGMQSVYTQGIPERMQELKSR
jgi:hypothetical protein